MTAPRCVFILFAMFTTVACNKGESTRIVMKNDTGGHMNDFALDYGSGTITYQIFSKDYTLAKDVHVKPGTSLTARYKDDRGQIVDVQIPEPTPEAGGSMNISFLPNGNASAVVKRFGAVAVSDKREENLSAAKKLYDALTIGMSAADVAAVFGHAVPDPKKKRYTFATDFGLSGKPQSVTLRAVVIDGELARAEITARDEGADGHTVLESKGELR